MNILTGIVCLLICLAALWVAGKVKGCMAQLMALVACCAAIAVWIAFVKVFGTSPFDFVVWVIEGFPSE